MTTTEEERDLTGPELQELDARQELPDDAPAPAGPEPLVSGTFAVFVTKQGDVILSTFTERTGDQQMRVPRFIVAQAKRQNPTLAKLLSGEAAA